MKIPVVLEVLLITTLVAYASAKSVVKGGLRCREIHHHKSDESIKHSTNR